MSHFVWTLLLGAMSLGPTGLLAATPTISGTPTKIILFDMYYGFTPTARDADGDALTFAIANRPYWAQFNSTTGRLYGTPKAADVRRYENIRISVSDGQSTVQLAAFAIDVVATGSSTVTVTWVPATTREDGSPLTNLRGHKVYWGTRKGTYPRVTTLTNPGITTYVVDGLVPGYYYVATRTLDTAGLESVLTPPVLAVVR